MNLAKIYVGNLPYSTTEEDVRDFFKQYGEMNEVKLISDFQTGRSKGFAFITFKDDEGGEAALAADGTELDGRKLKVNTAKESTRRSGGGRGGDRGGYGGGNRGGDRY